MPGGREYDYLIIGGGIAGVTAAETIRERDAHGSIAIVTREPHLLYSRVLLPSYLKGRIKRAQVLMRTVDDFDAKGIHYFANETAASIRPDRHEVLLASGSVFRYRKLLVASGGAVNDFSLGDGTRGVFRMQTLDDADAIHAALPRIRKAVVLGSSFIALEFLEVFSLNKIAVTLVMPHQRFFRSLVSPAGSELLHQNFARNGIEVLSGDLIAEVKSDGKILTAVETASGREIPTDALGVGIGIKREVGALRGSGISLGERGVLVNEYLESNLPDIYAAGDVAEFQDAVLGHRHALGNWNNAFLQGKTVGKTMAGERTEFRNVPNYSIVNLGLHLSAIGDAGAILPSVIRHRAGTTEYAEFFFREGALAGAFLINQPRLQPIIQRWIQERKKFGAAEVLQDFSRPLETLG